MPYPQDFVQNKAGLIVTVTLHALGLVFAIGLAYVILRNIVRISEYEALTPTRCEIEGMRFNCPLQKDFVITRSDGIIIEDTQASAKSQAACYKRAEEFFYWCNSSRPIVASFYRDGRLLGRYIHPKP